MSYDNPDHPEARLLEAVDDGVETTDHETQAERITRMALDRCRAELAELRAGRDHFNERIRQLVEQETTLEQAAGVFERRRNARRGEVTS